MTTTSPIKVNTTVILPRPGLHAASIGQSAASLSRPGPVFRAPRLAPLHRKAASQRALQRQRCRASDDFRTKPATRRNSEELLRARVDAARQQPRVIQLTLPNQTANGPHTKAERRLKLPRIGPIASVTSPRDMPFERTHHEDTAHFRRVPDRAAGRA